MTGTARQTPQAQDTGFAGTLSQAIAARGLSFRALAEEMTLRGAPITAPTLRSWASAASLPTRRSSIALIDTLESVLGIGTGMLHRHLYQWNVPEHRSVAPTIASLGADIGELVREWGLAQPVGYLRDIVVTTVQLENEHEGQVSQRNVVHAVHDGLDRIIVALDAMGLGSDTTLTSLTTVAGASLGREGALRHTMRLVEVILPRPLLAGEVSVIDLQYPVTCTPDDAREFRAVSLVPTMLLSATVSGPSTGALFRFARHIESVEGHVPHTRSTAPALPTASMTGVVKESEAALVTVSWSRMGDDSGEQRLKQRRG